MLVFFVVLFIIRYCMLPTACIVYDLSWRSYHLYYWYCRPCPFATYIQFCLIYLAYSVFHKHYILSYITFILILILSLLSVAYFCLQSISNIFFSFPYPIFVQVYLTWMFICFVIRHLYFYWSLCKHCEVVTAQVVFVLLENCLSTFLKLPAICWTAEISSICIYFLKVISSRHPLVNTIYITFNRL